MATALVLSTTRESAKERARFLALEIDPRTRVLSRESLDSLIEGYALAIGASITATPWYILELDDDEFEELIADPDGFF